MKAGMKNFKDILVEWFLRAGCVTTLVILWGCAGGAHVIPEVKIPDPLVESFPKTIGIVYPPELTEYVFDEKKIRLGQFIIELGGNQKQVFESSLGSIFADMVTLESMEDQSKPVDGIFKPKIAGMIVTVPKETGKDHFEVWIRYELELFRPNGDLIHKFRIPAYGKVNRRDYGNVMERSNQALQQATENALRDASTRIIIYFHPRLRPPAVHDWINS